MNGSKIIAIIPLTGCGEEFAKKLEVGVPYQFYRQYSIQLDNDAANVLNVKPESNNKVPEQLYRLKNNISVNFSAVVGTNGSGKSTLFELLFYMIYKLATLPMGGKEPIMKMAADDLKYEVRQLEEEVRDFRSATGPSTAPDENKSEKDVDLLVIDLLQRHGLRINTKLIDSKYGLHKKIAAALDSKIADKRHELKKALAFDELAKEKFRVSVIYQKGAEIRELHCSEGEIEHYLLSENDELKHPVSSFDLSEFFYTIGINYSHHSLNARTLGSWINKLFHKNDAYRTPLVINPMRDDGNFDINHELHLSRERLMSTLIYDMLADEPQGLLGKYTVSKFIFILKAVPSKPIYTNADLEKLASASALSWLYRSDQLDPGLPYIAEAINYLNIKIEKIFKNYRFLMREKGERLEVLRDFILDDDSHVTKKIRQTINYLKMIGNERSKELWSGSEESAFKEFSPGDLKEYIGLFGIDPAAAGPDDLVELALPGFFNIDFEFTDDQGGTIRLSQMSSGEQQMIFNTNAILYHLYNLQSAHDPKQTVNRGKGSEEIRPAYGSVNIVLDEMELYYHPEMQRQLVSNLMQAFETLMPEGGISSINVTILTHSPFILSDIPVQNVLRLGKRGRSDEQTFAANIHEILRHDFFLEASYMGVFANEKLHVLIDHLKAHAALYSRQSSGKKLSPLQRIKFLNGLALPRLKDPSQLMEKEQCEELIGLVGEQVLQLSLMELFTKAFPDDRSAYINKQIQFLEELKR